MEYTRLIRAVLFDLDGTLLNREYSVEQFLTAQYGRYAHDVGNVSRDVFVATAIELDRNGYAPRDQLYAKLAENLRLPAALGPRLLADFEQRFARSCTAFPEVHEELTALQLSGLRLGLVTNGYEGIQASKVAALEIGDHFDAILISEVEGVRKPDPAIFQRAVQRVGVPRENAVYVGDNPEADIRGAKNYGMRAVWRRNTFWPEPSEADAIIDSLVELRELVSRW